jgi:hypothetical protein
MKHEERKRELALKATPGPWIHEGDKGSGLIRFGSLERDQWLGQVFSDARWIYRDGFREGDRAESNVEHIAFHDPETVVLEADVIAWARVAYAAVSEQWPNSRMAEIGLRVFAALDAHASTRTQGRGDAHAAAKEKA